jgi:spore coat polysaccharide biosynthesis protein SpsF
MTRSLGRIAATIEARMTSTRLPGKVLMPSQGRPMLDLMIERVRRVPSLDSIIVCTTTNATDDPIVALCDQLGVGHWRGSEEDVLQRVLDGAKAHGIDTIVELTGDCPLIDPVLVENVISAYRDSDADYCANQLQRCYPIGMDTQVFSTDILDDVNRRTRAADDHEHVSLYIYRHPELYRLLHVPAPPEQHFPAMRLTLDTPEDYRLIDGIFSRLYPAKPDFSLPDILDLLKREPALLDINAHIKQKTV